MKAQRLIFAVIVLFCFVVLMVGWRGTAVQAGGV
jgi:hypothetical protein